MNKPNESPLPKFYDDEIAESGYETIQDFNLKWLLCCAEDKYKNVNPTLQEYARRTVFLLIYGKNNEEGKYVYILEHEMTDEFKVTCVCAMRQWKHIDLIAEIEIEGKSGQEKYVLNIENKFYSDIGPGQLENYKKSIEKEYESKVEKEKIINLCILCDEVKYDSALIFCKHANYKLLTMEYIQSLAKIKEKTGNALFDEYWFNFYSYKEPPTS